LRLALSKGPNRVDVSLLSPFDGNRSSYRTVVFSSYLQFPTTKKVHKTSDSELGIVSPDNFPSHNLVAGLVTSNPKIQKEDETNLIVRMDRIRLSFSDIVNLFKALTCPP
jgi:hypothetical protein